MKKIFLSLLTIVAVGGAVAGGTTAFFNDTETSTGNLFVAGSVDLTVDHSKQTYNGEDCVNNCLEVDGNLVVNGGFETPDIPTGTWALYPDGSLTSWTVESGPGLEIQDHAAGLPHGGGQLAELDSTGPSAISQVLPTVAGQKYKLRFWYSPRPGRPAGDNTIGAKVSVVSSGTVLVNDTIGSGAVGGSNTVWVEYVYNFIATGSATKIMFSDMSPNNSLGGYLDDISVRKLDCTSVPLPNGGMCTLWGERDLGQGDTFFNFPDVKPGDWGTNLISLHVETNDAKACLVVHNEENDENLRIDPEVAAGDLTTGTTGFGELGQYLDVVAWADNGDGIHQFTEPILGSVTTIETELISLSLTGGTTSYVGLGWCAGTLNFNPDGSFYCNGATMTDKAQTDSFKASVTAYAEQARNNPNFSCAGVEAMLEGEE